MFEQEHGAAVAFDGYPGMAYAKALALRADEGSSKNNKVRQFPLRNDHDLTNRITPEARSPCRLLSSRFPKWYHYWRTRSARVYLIDFGPTLCLLLKRATGEQADCISRSAS